MACSSGNHRKGVPIASSLAKTRKDIPCCSNCDFVPGKLADESKLGGINKLMAPYVQLPANPVPLKKRYRHESFATQTDLPNDCNAAKEDEDKTEVIKLIENDDLENMEKRLSKTDLQNNNYKKNAETPSKTLSNNDTKKERACKGKRYQKFMDQSLSGGRPRANAQRKKKLSVIQQIKCQLESQLPKRASKRCLHKRNNTNEEPKKSPGNDAISNPLNLLADLAEAAARIE